MVTKSDIQQLKEKDLEGLYALLNPESVSLSELSFILEHLGALPNSFDGDKFLFIIQSVQNINIQYWAIKNLAKLGDFRFFDPLFDLIQDHQDSQIRREATSAIGRMRNPDAIPSLLMLLQDYDPNIILQAVRGLLVFKGDQTVDRALQALSKHHNEQVADLIRKEYFTGRKQPLTSPIHSPDYLKNTAIQGDVNQILPLIPDESIHLTFTSPPYYNARDYSIYPSYQHYLDSLKNVFAEIHRITKEGRFCIINTSPVIVPRISRAHASRRYPIPFDIHGFMAELGWEFIDDIIWLKPEASVKNRNGGFQQHRKPLGYKPNTRTEYLMVYRKKTDKLLDWNMKQYPDELIQQSKVIDGFETSNVWSIDPVFDRVHSAVFPLELCYRVIRYYSYVGDLIFDPYAGSGTLGQAAIDLDRHFLLTELNETYFAHIQSRLGGGLFHASRFLTVDELRGDHEID